MTNVLIITEKKDAHARIVTEGLLRKGAFVERWFPEDFLIGSDQCQYHSCDDKLSLSVKDQTSIDLDKVEVVWFRRPKASSLPNDLHPLDKKFVESESRMNMQAVWHALGRSAMWINPLKSYEIANSKLCQLRSAKKIGFTIPDTLISNDKDLIVDFINKNQEFGTIYKTFSPAVWCEEENVYNFATTLVTSEMLPDRLNLKLTPGIYQRQILKSYEIRATFFSKECIAVKIHNSDELDWRLELTTGKIKLSPITLPELVVTKCLELMDELGIIFGCFDFIVTPSNEFVFLEVNEMGQFLWVEEILPELHLLDKFCEFILSGLKNSSQHKHEIVKLREITDSPAYKSLLTRDIELAKS